MMDYAPWVILALTIGGYVALALWMFYAIGNAFLVGKIVHQVGALRRYNNARWTALAYLLLVSLLNLYLVGFGESPLYFKKLSDITTDPGLKYEIEHREPILDNPVRRDYLETAANILSSGKREKQLEHEQKIAATKEGQAELQAATARAEQARKDKAAYVAANTPHYPSWFHFKLAVLLLIATIIYTPIAWREEFVEAIVEAKNKITGKSDTAVGKAKGDADSAPAKRGLLGLIASIVSVDLIMEVVIGFLSKIGRTLPIGRSAK